MGAMAGTIAILQSELFVLVSRLFLVDRFVFFHSALGSVEALEDSGFVQRLGLQASGGASFA